VASDEKVPRKYWWVVAVAVPVAVALIFVTTERLSPFCPDVRRESSERTLPSSQR